jgi:hypothetical protein
MSLSTNLVSLSTANERWEETQKNNQKALSYVNLSAVGCGAGLPSGYIVGAGLGLYTDTFLFMYVPVIISLCVFAPLGCGLLSYRKDYIKPRIWTWENVHAFKKELQSTAIDTLDLRIKNLAMEAGVISKENYLNWCTLIKEKQNLEKTKTLTLDFLKQSTVLQSDVAQKKQQYEEKFNELSTKWNTLKSDLLNDFPVEPSESVV